MLWPSLKSKMLLQKRTAEWIGRNWIELKVTKMLVWSQCYNGNKRAWDADICWEFRHLYYDISRFHWDKCIYLGAALFWVFPHPKKQHFFLMQLILFIPMSPAISLPKYCSKPWWLQSCAFCAVGVKKYCWNSLISVYYIWKMSLSHLFLLMPPNPFSTE